MKISNEIYCGKETSYGHVCGEKLTNGGFDLCDSCRNKNIGSVSRELLSIYLALRNLELALSNENGVKQLVPFADGYTLTIITKVKSIIDNLESSCENELQVLVAENVSLKYAISEINNSAEETPATDAAVRELMARGVDELISQRKSEWLDTYIDDAKLFAQQLREGGV